MTRWRSDTKAKWKHKNNYMICWKDATNMADKPSEKIFNHCFEQQSKINLVSSALEAQRSDGVLSWTLQLCVWISEIHANVLNRGTWAFSGTAVTHVFRNFSTLAVIVEKQEKRALTLYCASKIWCHAPSMVFGFKCLHNKRYILSHLHALFFIFFIFENESAWFEWRAVEL